MYADPALPLLPPALQALEFQAQQRLWALQQEELAAAGSSALRDAASTQASVLAAQLQRKAAEWKVEDEARSLKQQHELARKARLAAAAEKEAALQAAKGLMLAQELQTQEELTKVGGAEEVVCAQPPGQHFLSLWMVVQPLAASNETMPEHNSLQAALWQHQSGVPV